MPNIATIRVSRHCLMLALSAIILGLSSRDADATSKKPDGTKILLMSDKASAVNGQTIHLTVFMEEDGRPLVAKPVTVTAANGDSIALTTNVLGVATTPYKIPVLAPTAGYKLTADFAGDANDGPSDDTITVKVTNMIKMTVNPTSMTGPAIGSTFVATVTDNYGQPVVGVHVDFSYTMTYTSSEPLGIHGTITVYGSADTGADGTALVSTLVRRAVFPPGVLTAGQWPLRGKIPTISGNTLCVMTLTVPLGLP